jgi:hypothetical protein
MSFYFHPKVFFPTGNLKLREMPGRVIVKKKMVTQFSGRMSEFVDRETIKISTVLLVRPFVLRFATKSISVRVL